MWCNKSSYQTVLNERSLRSYGVEYAAASSALNPFSLLAYVALERRMLEKEASEVRHSAIQKQPVVPVACTT